MTKIQINNEVRDMTAEEQAEFDARQVTPQTALELEQEQTALANNKISATNKLKALGLTDAEIGALKI
jgi:hypothetical protein|tara:strand:+ start:550 stop:753 length:204 start_codon:yes stop_codon:yes gene_type:complete